MATWQVEMADGTTQEVEAHHAVPADAGALRFHDNNRDCASLILAPGTWKSCKMVKANPAGFPVS